MSYLVLARKWRPKRFAELVGQEHVVRALTNALDTGRVHHAFLFTGTRGVGKTTIARIFAKSLNCESGTSAEPCGQCATCQAIDAGRFIDLLEIDAASNTGVDDVREVIENAQYMPSRGRVKVYLIDEVHMLSKPAFNALLKTLEEPPEHVKFLLATTDPQKLPVTVLSRCLQFNLKRLDEDQIGGQIRMILGQEGIAAEDGAIRQLARAADGSLRDGLSLLDQAIAYTGAGAAGGALEDAAVATMLGTVDRTRVGQLLAALGQGDGAALLAEVEHLAGFSPDWGGVLDALADALHRVQVRQLVPDVQLEHDGIDVDALAASLRPELVQLWYQMALNGRRDLSLAPSPRTGFEMSVLRMLAFRPDAAGAQLSPPAPQDNAATPRAQPPATGGLSAAAAARAALDEPAPRARAAPLRSTQPQVEAPVRRAPTASPRPSAGKPVDVAPVDDWQPMQPSAAAAAPPAAQQESPPQPAPAAATPVSAHAGSQLPVLDAEAWLELVAATGLRGPARELAGHSAFLRHEGEVITLALSPADEHLKAPALVGMLANALGARLGATPVLRFELAQAAPGETLHQRGERQRDARQASAEEAFMNDPDVQRLMQRGAQVVPDSIRPIDD